MGLSQSLSDYSPLPTDEIPSIKLDSEKTLMTHKSRPAQEHENWVKELGSKFPAVRDDKGKLRYAGEILSFDLILALRRVEDFRNLDCRVDFVTIERAILLFRRQNREFSVKGVIRRNSNRVPEFRLRISVFAPAVRDNSSEWDFYRYFPIKK